MRRIGAGRNGFTLIEVILVLAIAAMIILIILLTLPAVQRNQRNQTRRNDVGKIIAAINEFKSNNYGKNVWTVSGGSPTGCYGSGDPIPNDVGGVCPLDPYVLLEGGMAYSFKVGNNITSPSDLDDQSDKDNGHIRVYVDYRCSAFNSNGTWRNVNDKWEASGHFAVIVLMETANSIKANRLYYCVEA